jgi:hypothetical protein
MLEHCLVEPVDLRFIKVRRDDAFPKVVENDVADRTPKVAESFFVKLGPDLFAGLPDHAPETA